MIYKNSDSSKIFITDTLVNYVNFFLILDCKMPSQPMQLKWYRMFLLVCFSFIIQVSAFSLTEIRCNVRQDALNRLRDGHVLTDAVQDEDFPFAIQKENCNKQIECVDIKDYDNPHTYIYTNMTNSSKFGFRFIWKVSFSSVSTYCNFEFYSSIANSGYLCFQQTEQVNVAALYYDCITGYLDFGKGTSLTGVRLQPTTNGIRKHLQIYTGAVNCHYKVVQKSEFCHHVEVTITKPINCFDRSFEIYYNISNLKQSTKFKIRLNSNGRIIFENATERSWNPTGKIQYILPNTSFYNATYEVLVFSSYEYPFDHNSRYTKRINITIVIQACLGSEPVYFD